MTFVFCNSGCPSTEPCSQGNCVYHSAESGLDGWDCECQTGYTGMYIFMA